MTSRLSNQKIENFVTGFSEKFGQHLLPDPKIIKRGEKGKHIYQKEFFDIYSGVKGNTRFSDWDIHCKLKDENTDISILRDMLSFIKAETDFIHVGVILTDQDILNGLDCHIAQKGSSILQCMGFMKSEKLSPFVDININGISGARREWIAPLVTGEEFICWAFITYWRKKLKKTDKDIWIAQSVLLDKIIFPLFPGFKALDDNHLILIMEKYLLENNYNDEVSFLKS